MALKAVKDAENTVDQFIVDAKETERQLSAARFKVRCSHTYSSGFLLLVTPE